MKAVLLRAGIDSAYGALFPVFADYTFEYIPIYYKDKKEIKRNERRTYLIRERGIAYYRSQGYNLTNKLLINTPTDRSREYTRPLPDYTIYANKNRIVMFLCHICCTTRYGEMTVD